MTIINLLSRILVLTKTLVFKNFLTKILFFGAVLFFLSSFNSPYPEPVYYEVNFNDGVTHLWSRQVYYDHIGFDKTHESVSKKYNNITSDSLTFYWAKHNYLYSRKALKQKIKSNMAAIMEHTNNK